LPPDLTLIPATAPRNVPTAITFVGNALTDGATCAFLPSGDDTCAGAAAGRLFPTGGVLSSRSLTVSLGGPMFYKLCVAPAGLPATLDAHFTYVSSAQLTITSTSSLASPPPSPLPSCSPPISCGPGTFYNSVANQCDIACGPSNGRRMVTEAPLEIADSADGAQIFADQMLDVVSRYLEKHAEVTPNLKDENLRSQIMQLLGQPALA